MAARGRRYPVGIAIGVLGVVVAIIAAGALLAGRGGSPAGVHAAATVPVRLVYAEPFGHSKAAPEAVWSATASNQHRIRLAIGSAPMVSPSGRWVAYDAGPLNHQTGLSLISSAGGRPRHVGTPGYPVAWSPNSRLVAVMDTSGQGLTVVHTRSLQSSKLNLPPESRDFQFSPDGKTLIFDHEESSSRVDLYTITLATGAVHRLTHDGRSYEPLWGPRGIAFDRFTAGRPGDVWLMSPGGADAHRLTHTTLGLYPADWSADGSRLLAAQPATNNGRLFAVDLTTGTVRTLTPLVGDLVPQGLSGDGKTVLAATGCGEIPGDTGTLETIPFTGGAPTVIERGACRGNWSG